MTEAVSATTLEPYLPRLTAAWARERPDERVRELDATLVSVDLSGFTALSERLAAKGRAGSEELILVISGVFEGLIGITLRHGGDVLKFRGDALLILFEGEGHAERACRASVDMQWFIEHAGSTMSSVGPVSLRMSTGVHTGTVHAFLLDATHRELMVTGPATTATFRLEDASQAGEVLVSEATAAAVDPAWLGERREEGILLTLEAAKDDDAAGETPAAAEVDLEPYVPKALRAQLAFARGEAEHRQATVAFLKYAGIDDVIDAEGAEGALEQLQQIATVVSRVCDELDITWLESDIDVNAGKIYLTAGAPASSGADEERMLRALRAILDEKLPLSLRAGVNRGPIFAGDIGATARRTYAVMGDAVNLAARLVARAQPGGLLATGEVLDRSATQFETEGQPILVKGKERAVTAYSVGRVTGVREEQAAQVLPVVGREPELTQLQEAVNAARMRQGRLVEIVGETGIGKTRLVEELKLLAVGFNQLTANCERYATQVPFYPFRENLRPLAGIMPGLSSEEAGAHLQGFIPAVMPDLAPWLPLLAIPFDAKVEMTPETEAIDEKFRRDKLHETLEQFFLRMFLMPTLMVFEDAQWMDDASRFALQHLMANPLGRPWLVVVTRRADGEPVAVDEARRAATWSARRGGGGAARALGGRRPAASAGHSHGVRGPVRRQPALRARARCGRARRSGHRHAAGVDRNAPHRADRRARRRRPHAAALRIGHRAELRPRAPARDPGRRARGRGRARPLAAARRVRRLGGRRRAALPPGPVPRDRLRGALVPPPARHPPPRRRRRSSGAPATAPTRRRGSSRCTSSRLRSTSGRGATRSWRATTRGRRSRTPSRPSCTTARSRRPISSSSTRPKWRLWPKRSGTCPSSSRRTSGPTRPTGGPRRSPRTRPRSHACSGSAASSASGRASTTRRSAGTSGRSSSSAPTATPHAARTLSSATAGVRFRQGEFALAIDHAKTAIGLAEAGADPRAVGHGHYLVDIALTRLGTPDPTRRERALPLLEEAGDLVGQSSLHNNAGVAAYYLGDWDDAVQHYRRSGELSARAGDVVNAARASNNEAEILSDQGRLDEARVLLEEAQRVWRAARYPIGAALATANLGRVAARARRFEDAHQLFEEAAAGFLEIGASSFVHENAARMLECLVLEGRYADARELLDATRTEAEAVGERGVLASLERSAGYAVVQARQPGGTARLHFDRSLELARELEARYEIALTLRALADTKLADDVDAARRESEDLLEQLGVLSLTTPPLP